MQDFEYTNDSAWEAYVRESIVPLKESSDYLTRYQQEVKNVFQGQSLAKFSDDEVLRPILFGGLTGEGKISERSLAGFYKWFFGLSYDYPKYRALAIEGQKPTDMNVNIAISPLVAFATLVSRLCSIVLQHQKIQPLEPEVDAQALLKDPKLLIGKIKEFHQKVINFTISYNPATYFIWTLRKNTWKYLTTAYKEMNDSKVFEVIRERLGLTELFKPDMPDPTRYTLWGYPEYGQNYALYQVYLPYTQDILERSKNLVDGVTTLGGTISILNEIIWNYLSKQSETHVTMILPNIPDAKKEFFDRAQPTDKMLLTPENYSLEGLTINWCGSIRKGYPVRPPIFLTKALDSLSASQFVGLIEYVVYYFTDGKSGQIRIDDRRRMT